MAATTPATAPSTATCPASTRSSRCSSNLIDIADSARAAAPDVLVMWYWGLRSPVLGAAWRFRSSSPACTWKAPAPAPIPTLYYRDSVTLAQDQGAQYARTIPPLDKDSLGVWLADNRWGNFMGKERWREALVMDLGRGSLLFPNLWGNLYHLSDDDVAFLARISALAKQNESLFLHRRKILGDPFRNEVYGYAHCQGDARLPLPEQRPLRRAPGRGVLWTAASASKRSRAPPFRWSPISPSGRGCCGPTARASKRVTRLDFGCAPSRC